MAKTSCCICNVYLRLVVGDRRGRLSRRHRHGRCAGCTLVGISVECEEHTDRPWSKLLAVCREHYYVFVFLFIYLFIYLFIHLFFHLFIFLFFCLFVYLFIYLAVDPLLAFLLIKSKSHHSSSGNRTQGPTLLHMVVFEGDH